MHHLKQVQAPYMKVGHKCIDMNCSIVAVNFTVEQQPEHEQI